jgi:hypothetical protein
LEPILKALPLEKMRPKSFGYGAQLLVWGDSQIAPKDARIVCLIASKQWQFKTERNMLHNLINQRQRPHKRARI